MTEQCDAGEIEGGLKLGNKVPLLVQTHLFEPLIQPGRVKERKGLTVIVRPRLCLRTTMQLQALPMRPRMHTLPAANHRAIHTPGLCINAIPRNHLTARRQLAMPTRRTDTQIKACSEHLTHPPRQGSTNQSEAKYIGSVGLNRKGEKKTKKNLHRKIKMLCNSLVVFLENFLQRVYKSVTKISGVTFPTHAECFLLHSVHAHGHRIN